MYFRSTIIITIGPNVMSSFSCPHLNSETNFCIKLNVDCVPGIKGCVLTRKFHFAFPAEDRIKQKDLIKRSKKK